VCRCDFSRLVSSTSAALCLMLVAQKPTLNNWATRYQIRIQTRIQIRIMFQQHIFSWRFTSHKGDDVLLYLAISCYLKQRANWHSTDMSPYHHHHDHTMWLPSPILAIYHLSEAFCSTLGELWTSPPQIEIQSVQRTSQLGCQVETGNWAPDGPGICDVALCCTEVAKIQSHGMNPRVVVFHTPRLQWCSTRVEIDCSVKMRSSWRESYDSMVLSETEKEPESCQKAATKLPHSLHTSSMMHDTANVFWVAVHKLVCSECMRV
jgi:hypothetical protein